MQRVYQIDYKDSEQAPYNKNVNHQNCQQLKLQNLEPIPSITKKNISSYQFILHELLQKID